MSKKKSFVSGTIDDFKVKLSEFNKSSETFTTVSSGLTRRIVLPNGAKMRFFGSENGNQIIDGAFLVQMVQHEIDEYIESKGVPSYKMVHDVQMFNTKLINKRLKEKPRPVIGIDMNACYWNTAHKLGYISTELYERGLKTAKKKGLLISIGCLNKKPIVKTYRNGKLIDSRFDEETYAKYSPFYWNIIAKTQDVMMESFEKFRDHWYMFLTDCLFVDAAVMKDAQEFLTNLGYGSKFHQIEFKQFDGFKLDWYDFKDEKPKKMYTGGRDIEAAYRDWKKTAGHKPRC